MSEYITELGLGSNKRNPDKIGKYVKRFKEDFPGTYTVFPPEFMVRVNGFGLPEEERVGLIEDIARWDDGEIEEFLTNMEGERVESLFDDLFVVISFLYVLVRNPKSRLKDRKEGGALETILFWDGLILLIMFFCLAGFGYLGVVLQEMVRAFPTNLPPFVPF